MDIVVSQATLNFVLVGMPRSGASILQTALCEHPQAVCHGQLFSSSEKTRRRAHERYFGDSHPNNPGWLHAGMSPEHYLGSRIFTQPRKDEKVVGVWLSYVELHRHDLWDFLKTQTLLGDFCVIHVLRNPLMCYVSWKQAQNSAVWRQDANEQPKEEIPAPVTIEPREFAEFCRSQLAWEAKLQAACPDRLEIRYQELFLNYRPVLRQVLKFLELEPCHLSPGTRRLRNRSPRSRIVDFDGALAACPQDLRHLFEAPDLF